MSPNRTMDFINFFLIRISEPLLRLKSANSISRRFCINHTYCIFYNLSIPPLFLIRNIKTYREYQNNAYDKNVRSTVPLTFESTRLKVKSYPIETHIAVKYRGASVCRNMKEPATPPSPFSAVVVAAETTRFHWLRTHQ